jgi:hypothetical protein
MKQSYIIALSVAAAVAASAGIASADPAGGQYLNKSTITSIGTGTNAATCTSLQQTKGTINYAFDGFTPSTASAKGAFNGVADAAGTYYVEDSSIPAGKTLIGTTLTSSIWAETFNNFGQLTPGSSAIGTLALTTKSATATTTGYSVVTSRTLTVGSAKCVYSTHDVWTKIG